ncbi:MAG TPA: YceI family protein [Flavobacteriaceae bacterium]|nr:YceI family protein [Flavobacteriaceae bacterium]
MYSTKRISIVIITILLSITIISCKKEIQKEISQFSIEQKTITVNWTGYKTTDKVAVKGEFKEIKILNIHNDTTAVGALNDTQFEIPISSLFSNDKERDPKLKELFFGVMDATLSLTGTLYLNNDGTGSIDLKMNGVQKKININYTVSGQLVELEGKLNLDDWNAQSALESLSKACFYLHKGADGVSKTWNDVGINAAIYLKKE